jgi:hypothetical protein
VDYSAYQQNADAFNYVIQQSIVDSVPGVTLSDIHDFFVTSGSSRRLQSAAAAESVPKDTASAEGDTQLRRGGGDAGDVNDNRDATDVKDTVVTADLVANKEREYVGAAGNNTESERRTNLRSQSAFHTTAASIVARYKIILTGAGQSYEEVASTIHTAAQTGQFDTALRENAVAMGVPELANATGGSISTVDVGGTDDDSSGDGGGGGSAAALPLPVRVGVAVGCGAVIGMIIAAFYFYCTRAPSGMAQSCYPRPLVRPAIYPASPVVQVLF